MVTVAEQRRVLAVHLEHHATAAGVILDVRRTRTWGRASALRPLGAHQAARIASRVPRAVDTAVAGTEVIEVFHADPEDIPPGARAGDIVIAWPVHRTYWRDGRADRSPLVDLGDALGKRPPARDYLHLVFLRPGRRGLQVIGEGFRA